MKKVLLFSTALLGLATIQASAQTKLIGVNTYGNDTLSYQQEYKFTGAIPDFRSISELKGGLDEGFAPKWNGADTVYSNDVLDNERLVTQITKYDAQRRPIEQQNLSSNGWYESILSTYHANGNVASRTSIGYDSTEIIGVAYLADGRVDTNYYMAIYNNADTVIQTTYSIYDANNRLTMTRDSVYNWTGLPNSYGYTANSSYYYYSNNTNPIADSILKFEASVNNGSYGVQEHKRSHFYTYNAADTLSDSLVYYYLNNPNGFEMKSYFHNGSDVTIISKYEHDNGVDTFRRYYKTVEATTNNVIIEDYVYGQWFDGARFDYAYRNVSDNEGYPLKSNELDSLGNLAVGYAIYNRFANKNIDSVSYSWGTSGIGYAKYVYDTTPTSIDETISTHDVTLYPNPATNTIQINVVGVQEYDVALYNVTGQLLGYYNNPKQIDISGRSAGTYFLQITDVKSKQSVTKSVIKK